MSADLEKDVRELQRDMCLMQNSVTKELASRDWVRELVQPIVENTRETKHAVETQGRDMQVFMTAHGKAMEQRAAQDQKEHEAKMAALEAQTWTNILKNKWAPLAAFMVAGAVILNHVASALLSWMQLHGATLK